MEPLAANRLFDILKVKHKKLKMEEPGLYLDVDKPFIGAFIASFHVYVMEKCVWKLSVLIP